MSRLTFPISIRTCRVMAATTSIGGAKRGKPELRGPRKLTNKTSLQGPLSLVIRQDENQPQANLLPQQPLPLAETVIQKQPIKANSFVGSA